MSSRDPDSTRPCATYVAATEARPARRSRLAARSHSWRNRRTSCSAGASGRASASSLNAPPACTGDSCAQSPTSSTFAPACVAAVAIRSRSNVPAIDASSTITSCPGRRAQRSYAARAAAVSASSLRVAGEGYARASRAAYSSAFALCSGSRSCSLIHLAVFSVGTPTASARTSAAAAEGARPTTDPGPWVASQAARTPAIAVDFPVPAAPTRRSTRRPEVTVAVTAAACSADR